MADPVTLALVGGGAAAGGSAVETFAKIQALKAQEKANKFTTDLAVQQTERQGQQVVSKGRAIGEAAGVVTASGSPLMQALDVVRQKEIQKLAISRKGAFERSLLRKQQALTLIGGLFDLGGVGASTAGSIGTMGGSAPTGGTT